MGAISVRECIYSMRQHHPNWRENQWVTELIWREFYRHLIDFHPHLSRSKNFIQTINPIPWHNNDALFKAWCNGETGFPIVDAAMLQLKQTGWMHNRLRMITATFLTKLLLIDWRKGEAFFMEHLLDGDYASNNGGQMLRPIFVSLTPNANPSVLTKKGDLSKNYSHSCHYSTKNLFMRRVAPKESNVATLSLLLIISMLGNVH